MTKGHGTRESLKSWTPLMLMLQILGQWLLAAATWPLTRLAQERAMIGESGRSSHQPPHPLKPWASPAGVTHSETSRLLGQTLVCPFQGPILNPRTRVAITDSFVGNFILKACHFQDALQASRLVQELQQLANDVGYSQPLLIGLEYDSGLVSTFFETLRFSNFPSPLALAAGHQLSTTFGVGEALGKEIRSVGINWIFAPNVDIVTLLTEPLDIFKSFSDDAEVVSDHALAFVKGLHSSGVVTCAVEALATTSQDVYTSMNREKHGDQAVRMMEREEFKPLQHLIGEQCLDSLQFTSLINEFQDPVKTGQSIDAALRVILRERLGYQRPVILDCSALLPDSNQCSIHAPLRSLLAGCDMVRLPDDSSEQTACISAIHAAAISTDLSESAILAAATRVSTLKTRFLSWDDALAPSEISTASLDQHSSLAKAAYYACITTLTVGPSPLIGFPSTSILLLLTPTVPFSSNLSSAPSSDPFEPLGRALERSHSRIRHVPYTVSAGLTSTHMVFLSRASAIVLVLRNSSSAFTEAQEEFTSHIRHVVQQRDASGPNAEALRKVVLGAGDPRDMKGDWPSWWQVCCYGYEREALEAAAEVIVGDRVAQGRTPVTLR